jgi:MYXO-CTERM domain-containing protein
VASAASAGATYGFSNITGNNLGDAAIGEAQFCVEVIESKKDSVVEFYFTNTGPDAASLVQLYWEDSSNVLNSLLGWETSTPSKATPNYGVDFSGGSASPGHLPGSNPKINDYSIQAKNQGGKSKNGVGAGEDVSVYFSFFGDYTSLLEAMDNGDLVVGTHAQAYKSGGSESFVSVPKGTPPTGVPSPTAALAGMVLMGVLVSRRRRRD